MWLPHQTAAVVTRAAQSLHKMGTAMTIDVNVGKMDVSRQANVATVAGGERSDLAICNGIRSAWTVSHQHRASLQSHAKYITS
jgi:hypothetical protein